MPTEVTSLIIKADSSEIRKADRDLDAMARSAGTADRASDKLQKGAKYLAAGLSIVAVAAAAVATAMVKMSLVSIDSLAKTADMLGVTTERLAGLQLAANLAGVDTGKLNNSLRYMVKNVAEAATGIGTAKDALDALGLSAEELNRLSPDEQIRLIGDAFGNVANQGDKVLYAMDIFGRDGAALVNLLAAGSAGLDEAEKRARAYGTALSRVDAAKVEAANDAITEAKAAFAGIAATLTVYLAPMIKAVADGLSEASLEANGFRDSVVSSVEISIKAVGFLADIVFTVGLGFKTMSVVALGVFAAMESGIDRLSSRFGGFTKDYIDFYNKYLNLGEDLIFDSLARNAGISADALRKAKIELFEMTSQGPPSARITEFFDDLKRKAELAGKAIADAKMAASGDGGGAARALRAKGFVSDFDPFMQERFVLPGQDKDILGLEKAGDELLTAYREKKFALIRSAQEEHNNKLRFIQATATEHQLYAEQRADALRLKGKEQFFNNMTGLMNTSNRKMFEVGKAAAIAQAVVKGHEAIMSAYAAGMATTGPHAPFVAAAYMAAAAAQTANLIGNIASSSFGGGGGAPTPVGQGSSGYSTSNSFFSSSTMAADNTNVMIELTQAIRALQGIPPGQVITTGLAQAGGLVAVSSDQHINELAREITGSVYV